MIMKKIGVASAALVLCAGLPLQSIAMASENATSYTANKAENKLKGLQVTENGSFSDVTDYFSVVPGKSSTIEKNKVTITPNKAIQVGALWSDINNKVDLTKNFHLEADLYMGDDSDGADGMAFVMQNDPRGQNAISDAGGSLGMYGKSYIKNALAVEFDTYVNVGSYGEYWDNDVKPGREHMAITVPGVGPVIDHKALNVLPEGVYFEDGKEHPVVFDWDAATKTLSYSYQSYTGSYQVDDLQAAFGGTDIIFGFVGSTGAKSNLQQLTVTNLQINGISPKLQLDIKTANAGKVEQSEKVTVKNTISNETADASAFTMQYGTDVDALFDTNTIENIRLTRNDGQVFTVSKSELLNHQVELSFTKATDVFTLTYDVMVKADAAPKGADLKITGIGKVNGVKYTSENTVKLVIPGDKPVITANDASVKKGKTFDPMAGVTASDTEDGDMTSKVTVTANDVDTSKVGTYHVTYSVTDSDDNTTTKTITVTVTSNDAPVIVANDVTVKKGSAFNPLDGVTATDTEDGNVTSQVIVTANDVNTSKIGTYHVTYSVTDSDGNTTTKTISVTISNTEAPTIVATDTPVKKGKTFDPMAGVTASDTDDGDVTSRMTVTANDVDTSKVGTYHVTYSVTNSDGNTATKTITVTVTSDAAPVILATDTTVKKGKTFDPKAGMTATDSSDGDMTSRVVVTANDVDTSKVGTYHVTYSVTNSDGNTTTKTITVTVTSNDAPVITAKDQSVKKGKTFSPLAGVTASDTEDGNVTSKVKVTANNVDTSNVGTYHVTYSVTDSDGNTTTKTITVTVTSNDVPVIEASDIVQRIHQPFDVKKAVTARDTEDGDLTSKLTVTANDVNTEKAGVYHVTYSVTDSDGNTITKTIQVTILTNDAPVITTSDLYLKVGDKINPFDGVTSSDLEDGDLTLAVEILSNNVNMAAAGAYEILYAVTDSDGNTTKATRHVYVRTNDKPEIHVADQTFKAGFAFDPMTGVSASDLEDGDLSDNVKIIANDVNIDVAGDYHITYSVLDSDGNTTEKTITITVLSNDKPVITGQDTSFKAGRAFDPMAGITASDTEDGDITANIEILSNDVNPDVAGVYHITYSITDSDGNTTEQTYTVTVLTNEKPVIHASDITLAFGQAFDPMAGVTAEDLEDGDITSQIKVINNDVNPNVAGIYHVTYSVTDSDGNETQVTITVLVGAQPIVPVDPITPVTPVIPVTPAQPTTPSVTQAPVTTPVVPVKVSQPTTAAPTKALPQTGDSDTTSTVLFGGLLAALGALFLRRRK
ncbi:immunoglobulin-like domain-containing protein [Listeria newyorkensis]|uniref:DUF5011 domain-containing protein n=1 Tax=Listeria newyorkensis TaxID=1497681 RepID=A0A841YZQ8_9LIST|nr:immunoglobulin-like domain-containing protein [Listeria newyorkensis]MBC1458808.1 DUF5011 domain-containing protein [Listeria newyorkensis]